MRDLVGGDVIAVGHEHGVLFFCVFVGRRHIQILRRVVDVSVDSDGEFVLDTSVNTVFALGFLDRLEIRLILRHWHRVRQITPVDPQPDVKRDSCEIDGRHDVVVVERITMSDHLEAVCRRSIERIHEMLADHLCERYLILDLKLLKWSPNLLINRHRELLDHSEERRVVTDVVLVRN